MKKLIKILKKSFKDTYNDGVKSFKGMQNIYRIEFYEEENFLVKGVYYVIIIAASPFAFLINFFGEVFESLGSKKVKQDDS